MEPTSIDDRSWENLFDGLDQGTLKISVDKGWFETWEVLFDTFKNGSVKTIQFRSHQDVENGQHHTFVWHKYIEDLREWLRSSVKGGISKYKSAVMIKDTEQQTTSENECHLRDTLVHISNTSAVKWLGWLDTFIFSFKSIQNFLNGCRTMRKSVIKEEFNIDIYFTSKP